MYTQSIRSIWSCSYWPILEKVQLFHVAFQVYCKCWTIKLWQFPYIWLQPALRAFLAIYWQNGYGWRWPYILGNILVMHYWHRHLGGTPCPTMPYVTMHYWHLGIYPTCPSWCHYTECWLNCQREASASNNTRILAPHLGYRTTGDQYCTNNQQ